MPLRFLHMRRFIRVLLCPSTICLLLLIGCIKTVAITQSLFNQESSPDLGLADSVRGYVIDGLPTVGQTPDGQTVSLGGFSGLSFTGQKRGCLFFITHPDRGPNGDAIAKPSRLQQRIFFSPSFQPRLIKLQLCKGGLGIEVAAYQPLFKKPGVAMSGLPNLPGKVGLPYSDELPTTADGVALKHDLLGADLEGIALAPDGSYWMADEYRPSIFHFDAKGVLIDRYVPAGSNQPDAKVGVENLPAHFSRRQMNRGFEAIALVGNSLYVFLQGPLNDTDDPLNKISNESTIVRMLEFDIQQKNVVGEYLIELARPLHKIGGATATVDGKILISEHDTTIGANAFRKLYRLDLDQATNILHRPESKKTLESMPVASIKKSGIQFVTKNVAVDLATLGFGQFEKIEGIAMVDETTLAIVNDNDFQLAVRRKSPSMLFLVKLPSRPQ